MDGLLDAVDRMAGAWARWMLSVAGVDLDAVLDYIDAAGTAEDT